MRQFGGFFFDAIRRKKIYNRNVRTDSMDRISLGTDKKIKTAFTFIERFYNG